MTSAQFTCWYLNLQEPLRRTAVGYDTQDHELDVVVFPDGQWLLKDDEKMEQRIREGRYSAAEVVEIRALGARLAAMVDAGETWWAPTYVVGSRSVVGHSVVAARLGTCRGSLKEALRASTVRRRRAPVWPR